MTNAEYNKRFETLINKGFTEQEIIDLIGNKPTNFAEVVGNNLILTIPFNGERDNMSGTGNSYLHASSNGFKVASNIVIDGVPLKINVTAITKV